jgi:hypothetical protein
MLSFLYSALAFSYGVLMTSLVRYLWRGRDWRSKEYWFWFGVALLFSAITSIILLVTLIQAHIL